MVTFIRKARQINSQILLKMKKGFIIFTIVVALFLCAVNIMDLFDYLSAPENFHIGADGMVCNGGFAYTSSTAFIFFRTASALLWGAYFLRALFKRDKWTIILLIAAFLLDLVNFLPVYFPISV